MARSLRPIDVFPITVRRLEVLRVCDVTPGMRRVTLGGPGLEAHTADNGMPVAAFRSEGFDDEFKLFLTHPDLDAPLVPAQGDGVVIWPHDPKCLHRTYTVRRWDPRAGELDVDVVQHGVGPATVWSRTARAGQPVWIAGPKSSAAHPAGVDWTLVAGDETALPAIGRWLEQWPDGARGQVFIEVAEDSHIQDLPRPEGVEITWLSRRGAEAGTTTLLFDALRAAPWWEGEVFAWVAGEALTLAPIRRWLRGDRGLDRSRMEVTGYWRRQEVVVDASAESGIDLNATKDTFLVLHELTEMMPGMALRVAATIGLGRALERGPRTLAELVGATGADPVGLTKLLRYLASIEFVALEAQGRYDLTDVGRELCDEEMASRLSLDRPFARRDLGALLGLLTAVRTGAGQAPGEGDEADALRRLGLDLSGLRLDPATGGPSESRLLEALMEDEAEMAHYVVGALVEAPVVADLPEGAELLVAGKAPGATARALVEAGAGRRATVRALPSQIEVLRRMHPEHERIAYEAGSLMAERRDPVDAAVLVEALESCPWADAVHLLRTVAAGLRPGGRVVLLTDLLDVDQLNDHVCQEDLTAFALGGSGLRTAEEYRGLFVEAGLDEPVITTVGWGFALLSAGRRV